MAITSKPITHGKEREYRGLSTDTKPTVNVGLNSLFLELDTGDFYYWSGSAWAKIGTAAALTDLTGTTWHINDTPDLGSTTNAYGLIFTSVTSWGTFIIAGDDGLLLYNNDESPLDVYSTSDGWSSESGYRTVAITGGSDATNANLIAWFEANATRVA